MATKIDALKNRLYEINALQAATAIFDWDQQCFMPKGGAEARAAQTSILSRMAHELSVSEETLRLLEEAEKEAQPGTEDEALCRIVRRNTDKVTKLPSDLVEKEARLAAEGHEAWVEARANNDFKSYAPKLAELFELNREKAELLGYKDHIYDALLDMYEEGATAADCRNMFETLKQPTIELVKQIKDAPQPDDSFLTSDWDAAAQSRFTEWLAGQIGYDFNRGRQDTAPHPFCTGWSVGDIRITTRFLKELDSAIYGTLHESGHAMYEQGCPQKWDRLPLAGGVSLGVHESQSRLWENIVGRSPEFIGWMMPHLKQHFPQLDSIDAKTFYRAVNKVQPSFIRVEADEVTYNMHVLIRFEIECEMLTGKITVNDLPEAWNAKYTEYLGITPKTDSEGCLQDVHWSMGSIGYFPTYSMGNLLSYQIWNAMKKDNPNAEDQMAAGKFDQILAWLQEHVYQHGSRYTPKDLVMRATGKPIGAEDYVQGLRAKYSDLYGLNMAGVS